MTGGSPLAWAASAAAAAASLVAAVRHPPRRDPPADAEPAPVGLHDLRVTSGRGGGRSTPLPPPSPKLGGAGDIACVAASSADPPSPAPQERGAGTQETRAPPLKSALGGTRRRDRPPMSSAAPSRSVSFVFAPEAAADDEAVVVSHIGEGGRSTFFSAGRPATPDDTPPRARPVPAPESSSGSDTDSQTGTDDGREGGGAAAATTSSAALPRLAVRPAAARRVSRSFSEPNLSGVAELEARRADEAADEEEREAHCASDDDDGETDPARLRPPAAAAPPLCLRLDVLAGPAAGLSVRTPPGAGEVTIGRAPSNGLVLPDGEVSGTHAILRWDGGARAWTVTDAGSLNGTRVDGRGVGAGARRRGRTARLTGDAILSLGRQSQLRVVYLPPEVAVAESAAACAGAGPPAPLRLPALAPPPGLRPLATIDAESSSMSAAAADAARAAAAAASPTRARLAAPTLGLAAAAVTIVGVEHARRDMECEDVALLLEGVGGGAATFLAVFDGHGGARAADAAAAALPSALAARAAASAAGLDDEAAWTAAFADADAASPPDGGATATLVAVWRPPGGGLALRAANVGDSAAVLVVECGGEGDADPAPRTPPQPVGHSGAASPPPATPRTPPPAATPPSPASPASPGEPPAAAGATLATLTADHRLSAAPERARLAAAGVCLPAGAAPRLYGLNLSRCLGDRAIKEGDLGLLATPHVSPITLLPPGSRALLLLASDGVWDVASARRAAGAARAAAAAADAAGAGAQAAAADAADAVAALALRRHSRDDVTALVAVLRA